MNIVNDTTLTLIKVTDMTKHTGPIFDTVEQAEAAIAQKALEINAKASPKRLNAAEVKKVAKELKVKDWWNKKRDVLVAEISELKGWSHEKPEVIEYFLAGGKITKCEPAAAPATKVTKETQAMVKPTRRKPTKKSTKVKGESKPRTPVEGMVTLAAICEELGVESRIARRKLRGSDIEKPAGSWAWEEGSKEIQKVKDLLK